MKGRTVATILDAHNHPGTPEYIATLHGCSGHPLLGVGDGWRAFDLVRFERPDPVVSNFLITTIPGFEGRTKSTYGCLSSSATNPLGAALPACYGLTQRCTVSSASAPRTRV